MVRSAKEPSRLAIVPTSGIYLVRRGHGNERRFAGLFRDVWRSLPGTVRHSIRQHWRGELWGGDHDLESLPQIELLHGWTGILPAHTVEPGTDPDPSLPEYAEVSREGFRMRFRATAIDRMPDDVVKALIAHELAHVYQHAYQSPRKHRRKGYLFWFETDKPGIDVLEEHADELMWEWGYEDDTITEWEAANEDLKPLEDDSLHGWAETMYGPGGRWATTWSSGAEMMAANARLRSAQMPGRERVRVRVSVGGNLYVAADGVIPGGAGGEVVLVLLEPTRRPFRPAGSVVVGRWAGERTATGERVIVAQGLSS